VLRTRLNKTENKKTDDDLQIFIKENSYGYLIFYFDRESVLKIDGKLHLIYKNC